MTRPCDCNRFDCMYCRRYLIANILNAHQIKTTHYLKHYKNLECQCGEKIRVEYKNSVKGALIGHQADMIAFPS